MDIEDVDILFEKHSVTEIDTINGQRKLQIEKKREELRTMVGERYRDLLKAADTINNMRNTSANVIEGINQVISKSKTINEQQLLGFKANDRSLGPNPRPAAFYSLCLQVKLLTELPELIWSHLDADEYVLATQLFIFARHINTGLRLDASAMGPMLPQFPIIKSQWLVLSRFFQIIKEKCLQRLEVEDLSATVASKCLASLILLDSCGLDSVLKTLIQLRTRTFVAVLRDPEGHFEMVKDRLLASLNILNETILLVHECFIGSHNQNGLLMQELHKLSSNTSPYSISYTSASGAKHLQYLPDIITKHRPNLTFTSTLSDAMLQEVMTTWMRQLAEISACEIKTLVNLIGSVKVVRDIKQNSHAPEFKNWTEMIKSLQLPASLNFYQQFYQHLINDRVKEIIQTNWNENLMQIGREIDELMATEDANDHMIKYTWTEDSQDVPLSLDQALDADKKQQRLLMKSLGFVPDLVGICHHFDDNLQVLYKDIDNYVTKVTPGGHYKMKRDIEDDKQELIEFLIRSSEQGVTKLIKAMRESAEANKSAENFIKMARLCQALMELCPHLRLCLAYSMATAATTPSGDHWEQSRRLLLEESLNFWRLWLKEYLTQWTAANPIETTMSYASVLEEWGTWEEVTIEEKDEAENVVESVIRVPSQASWPLQSQLYHITADLNRVIPHTVPPKIIAELVEGLMASHLLATYRWKSEAEFVKTNQNCSLQCYFDLKYLSLLLMSSDSMKSANTDAAERMANAFKSYVDPFDFELFFPYLTRNVKRAVQRSCGLLGVIVPNLDHLLTILGQQQDARKMGNEKEPNVLALSNCSTLWFPLLPIASGPTQKGHDEGPAAVGMGSSQQQQQQPPLEQQQNHQQQQQLSTNRGGSVVGGAVSGSSGARPQVQSAAQQYAAAFFGSIFQGQ